MSGPEARWARIEALFDGALERPRTERAAWLGAAAAADPGLRDEVWAMLAAHDQVDGVLDRPLPIPSIPAGIPPGFAQAIADRYVLAEPIGEGGMAHVILALDRSSDRLVVIKVLKPEIATWFGADRFRTEVELAARLSHPHILGLIDSGESGEFLYYVMPYLGGETLRSRLQRQGRLDRAEAIGLLRDLADALAYAHRAGVVHRDLKPENVLCAGGRALL
ncbi:MAG TPA: serine/threonine-protein kinase, partial [Gemmatimonadales bacterium]